MGRVVINFSMVGEGFGDLKALLLGEWDDRGARGRGATTTIYVDTK